jgi:hypothetical protein
MTGSKRVDLWTSGTVCECSEIAGSPQDSKLLSFSKLSFRLKTGESITNTNNSANIQKIRNHFWTCLFGPEEVVWRKKTVMKMLVTVFLSVQYLISLLSDKFGN